MLLIDKINKIGLIIYILFNLNKDINRKLCK